MLRRTLSRGGFNNRQPFGNRFSSLFSWKMFSSSALCPFRLWSLPQSCSMLRMSRLKWKRVKWNAQAHAWCRRSAFTDRPLDAKEPVLPSFITGSPSFLWESAAARVPLATVTSTTYSPSDLQWVTAVISILPSHCFWSAERWGGNERERKTWSYHNFNSNNTDVTGLFPFILGVPWLSDALSVFADVAPSTVLW